MCNLGRQSEIDCLKAFCIIPMILLHTFEEFAEDPNIVWTVLDIIEGFSGAAAFMICMGLGSKYSRHTSPRDYLVRGLEILTTGQLLNLLRDAIPNLLAYRLTGTKMFLANGLLVIQADILTFAGLAFILAGFFRTTGSYILDQFLGFFVVTAAESYFPLASYFIFVAFGYALGDLYQHISDKNTLSSKVLFICLPVSITYYLVRSFFSLPLMPKLFSIECYIMNPLTDAWVNCMSSLCLIALFYKLLALNGGRLPRFIAHLSKHINSYYCLSFILITPIETMYLALKGELLHGILIPLAYGVIVIVLCYVLIECNERHFHFGISALKEKKRIIVYSMIWILTFAVVLYVYPRLTEYSNVWNNYLLD